MKSEARRTQIRPVAGCGGFLNHREPKLNSFPETTKRRWMLVDDSSDTLLMMSLMLENLVSVGVECHTSPAAALAAFQAAPEKYELVITDFEMPGMDGVELCRRLRAVAPAQKVFLATGSGFFTAAAARHAGFSALLNKPFPLSTVKQALAEAFAGTTPDLAAPLGAA